MLADALSQLSIGSVTDGQDNNKELVCDVHKFSQLGVFLVDSNDGGVIVQNNLKLPLVSNVKNKKDLDPLLVNLKKLVSKKSVEAISKGMVFFYIKVCFVF